MPGLAHLEDLDIPVARGTKRLRHTLTLALLIAGVGGVWAARLDKTACADLNTELSGLLASGLKEDMDKGAAWAGANLSPERLASINRVVELQGQLEFRCGASPGRNVAKSPKGKSPGDKSAPDKATDSKTSTAKSNGEDLDDASSVTKPNQKVRTLRRKRGSAATTPELPAVVPPTATSAAQPTAPAAVTTAKPAAEVDTTAAAASAAVAPASPVPEVSKTAATAAPAAAPPQAGKVTPVSTTPQAASDAKVVPPVVPVTAPTPAPAPDQAGATVPGAKKAAAQKAARKPPRRDSSGAYVSPKVVDPFSMTTGGN